MDPGGAVRPGGEGGTVTGSPVLLCVHPHPDDESIACGGVLARAAAEGVRTVVVTCTDGEEGENLGGIDLGGRSLTEVRRDELDAAIRILGVAAHHRLGYRDSGMAGTAGNDHPDCFHRADTEAAARRLAAILRAERPTAVVSDDARGTYGHPDHIKAHAVTVRAVALAADPTAPVPGAPWRVARRAVHAYSETRLRAAQDALTAAGLPSPFEERPDGFGTPDRAVTTRVDVAAFAPTKLAAMRAHLSQLAPDSFFLNLADVAIEGFFGVEEFVIEDGDRVAGDATDLLA
jgi:LmbE family N-acetylglucosaminyl deacetylase